jgi:CRISPR-associated endoribonuclease Cas6
MRFCLTLQSTGTINILPVNYQYELSGWIYKTLHFGNPEFSEWLHNHGYVDGNKKFRFFTFSGLKTGKYHINGDRFEIPENRIRTENE